ncbi:MAG TPA: amidohydrolase family protein [Candidatus Cybelea sp.]|nr:amidohydrolase family protein [Candidatus Cybelea sp.]
MKRVALFFLFAVLFTIRPAMAQQGRAPAEIGVQAGRILDVRSGNYLADQMIWVEGERIKAVGRASEIRRQLPAGAKIIDLSRATVLPGLIDCHVHLTMSPTLAGPARLHISYPRSALLGARNARVTLEAGFTTVRNVAAGGYSDIALRDAINAGDVPGPRMLVSGPALSITGGHADENYLAPQYDFSEDGVADGVDAVVRKVRENIKFGADVIKFMATGGVLSEGDNPALAQYSPEEMKAIVQTAHELGRRVAAHAHGALGIKYAVLAGVDSIEHGSYINDEDIELMKERGTYLVPTVYLEDWLAQNMQNLGFTPNMIEKAQTVLPIAQEHLSHALKSGLKIALGTDAAVYPHGLNAHEFGKMVDMGLTPLQSIQAGTVNAADLLGWSDRVGSIEPGKFADLVAVDGDPLANVHVLENVRFVMKGGEVIKNQEP